MYILFLLISFSSKAQVNFDSLWNIWQDTTLKNDTRFRALDDIIWENYVFSNPDSAIILAKLEIEFSKAIGEKNYEATAYNNIGLSFDVKGDFKNALNSYQKSLAIKEEIGDKKAIASTYNNIGIIYNSMGNMAMSLKYYKMSLALHKETGDTNSLGSNYNNIGIIYRVQKNYEKAMEYYLLGLEKRKHENDTKGIAGSFTNIANLFYEKEQYDSSLYYHKKSLEIHQNGNDLQGIAGSYGNIAGLHHALNQDDKAIEFFNKSLALSKQIGDKLSTANAYSNLGVLYFHLKKNNLALEFLLKSKKLFLDLNTIANLESDCKTLYEIYKAKGNLTKAIENYELHVMFKDSLDKMDANNQLYQFEAEKAFEISRLTDSIKYADEILIQQAENLAKEEQLKSEKQRRTALLIIVGLVLVSLGFVFIQLRKTRAQKVVIEGQHQKLNQSHQEITDSINYAKRIQDALMTSTVYMKDVIPESFIFFQPKDVVSGDFYWVYRSPKGQIYFTVADCTGHGVPGAFMSMIGTSLLNEFIIENNLEDTAEILTNMRKQIIKSLKQEGADADNKDGMDMALCKYDPKKKTVQFSGAYNPLIHITKNEINHIKGDNQPIGLHTGRKLPFTNHEIKVKKGDMLYIYSDGFADQFGGERGKKYMSGKFKKFLLSISEMKTEQQDKLIKEEFTKWLGKNEQIDDVCVMGVRIT